MNQKIALLIIVSMFCFRPAPCNAAATSAPVFNQAIFDIHVALYGNKTANLIELKKIVNFLNTTRNDGLLFDVPPFFCLSSPEIIDYLKTTSYASTNTWEYILAQWELFKAAQPRNASQLSMHAREALSTIRAAIEQTYFDPLAIVSQNFERFHELQLLFDTAAQNNKLLMVRSTGREDSKELSNAGGNASVASVSPTNREQLSKAIQEVLSSYLSEKSISQRLLGKDLHVFDEPFMAVLLQVMTGEVFGIDIEIPKSGVIFIPEAEGETPGVVVIQATFGHNEGVVNGLVPVDTYYVGPINIIHPLICIKRKRLAAKTGEEGLHFIDNDLAMQRISTLNAKTVHALTYAAKFIQHYYGNAVDIEFVILNNTVYFVQARPLEAKKFDASFLKPEFIAQSQNKIMSVAPIGVGNAAAQIITNPAHLIVTGNIRQALDTFLFKTAAQDAIQAVIIQESAPATSHEATQFRRLGIPVLYAQDINRVRSWLEQLSQSKTTSREEPSYSSAASSSQLPQEIALSGYCLLIDLQREVIAQYAPDSSFPNPEQTITQGWFAHPIAKKVSVMSDFISKVSPLPEDLKPQELFKGTKSSALLDIIKNENYEQAHNALCSLLHRMLHTMHAVLTKQKLLYRTNDKLVAQLKRIYLDSITSAYEIDATLKTDAISRLERLYPITFFEALLRQIPDPLQFVNDYSFGALLKTEQREQRSVEQLNLQGAPFRSYTVQYAKAGAYAFTPNVSNNWNTFLTDFAGAPADLQQKFAQLMLQITDLGILPLWLNTAFEQTYIKQQKNAETTLQALISAHKRADKFLAYIQKKLHYFNAFHEHNFEDPAAFEPLFNNLKQQIMPLLTGPFFLSKLSATTDIGTVAALHLMQTAVETVDKSIKALTGSKCYVDKQQQVERFNTMLKLYFHMLQSWAGISKLQPKLTSLLESTFSDVRTYLSTIKQAFPEDLSPAQLSASPGFNVGGATLGSKTNWRRSTPNPLTLEDLFTLIHQNLLVVLSALTEQSSLARIELPPIVEEIRRFAQTHMLVKSETGRHRPQLIGINYAKNTLSYHYNLPQRNHSSTFQINYNTQTQQTDIAVSFFGQALTRWQLFGDTAFLIAKAIGFTIASPIDIDVDRGLLSFTWGINTLDQAQKALRYLQMMADFAPGNILRAYQRNLFSILASTGNIPPEKLIDTLLNAVPEHPGLIAYTTEIIALKGPEYPALKQIYQKLLNVFPKMPATSQHIALDIISRILSSIPASIIINELLPLIAYASTAKLIREDMMETIIAILLEKIDIHSILNLITTMFNNVADPALQEIGLKMLMTLGVNAEKPIPLELVQYINEILARFIDSTEPALQDSLASFVLFVRAFQKKIPLTKENRRAVKAFLSNIETNK